MFIETHAHLTDAAFDMDRDDVWARAREAGVDMFVEIGEDEPQWVKARAFAETHPGVYWTAGFHPYYAVRADAGLAVRLAEALGHPLCVAVGEIGLDYHRPDSPRDVQIKVLDDLLCLAWGAGKPVVIHCRESAPGRTEAERDLIEILARHQPPGSGRPSGVAHCFQGTAEAAERLQVLGFVFGVDGPITYPKARALRDVIATLPLESLVLETDSPYLPPQSHRGRRNEPAHIPAVARALAELKGVSLDTVARVTSANARRLFRLPPP